MPPVESAWLWLGTAALLALIEIIAPGFFLIWVAAAAAATGLVTAVLGLPPAGDLGVFAVALLGAVLSARQLGYGNTAPSSDPLLNERAVRLIGREVTVQEPLIGGQGRVRIGDSTWQATGPDLPSGSRAVITGVDGTVVRVEIVRVE